MNDDQLIAAALAAVAQQQFGLEPFDPAKNTAQDVGLGGPSTEYLATEYDPSGQAMNYPQIWWDKQGAPQLLEPDAAYNQAMAYEAATPKRFPRFPSIDAAVFAALNRSEMGGGSLGPIALGFRGYQP